GLGGTNLAVDGHVNATLDLRFAVTSKDLSLLAPESRGQLEGNGTLRGTLRQPTIAASFHGHGIRHEGITVDGIDTEIDFDPNTQYESKIDARIHNLTYQERTLEHFAFKLNGKSTNHSARHDAQAIGMSLRALAKGPVNDGVWHGQLRTVDIVGTELTRLKLEKSVGLQVSADGVRAEWMCVVGKPGSMCADGEWTPSQWTATFNANKMPLSTFTPGLTHGVEYSGQINFVARLSGTGQESPQGSVRIDLTDAQLVHRLS